METLMILTVAFFLLFVAAVFAWDEERFYRKHYEKLYRMNEEFIDEYIAERELDKIDLDDLN